MAIPPLTCSTKLGQPYTRPAEVEAQIEEALRHLPDDWGRTSACDWADWHLETFVHLARLQARANTKTVFGRLVEEFLERAGRVIRKYSKGFSVADSEEIQKEVFEQIDERLMAATPSRASEFRLCEHWGTPTLHRDLQNRTRKTGSGLCRWTYPVSVDSYDFGIRLL